MIGVCCVVWGLAGRFFCLVIFFWGGWFFLFLFFVGGRGLCGLWGDVCVEWHRLAICVLLGKVGWCPAGGCCRVLVAIFFSAWLSFRCWLTVILCLFAHVPVVGMLPRFQSRAPVTVWLSSWGLFGRCRVISSVLSPAGLPYRVAREFWEQAGSRSALFRSALDRSPPTT